MVTIAPAKAGGVVGLLLRVTTRTGELVTGGGPGGRQADSDAAQPVAPAAARIEARGDLHAASHDCIRWCRDRHCGFLHHLHCPQQPAGQRQGGAARQSGGADNGLSTRVSSPESGAAMRAGLAGARASVEIEASASNGLSLQRRDKRRSTRTSRPTDAKRTVLTRRPIRKSTSEDDARNPRQATTRMEPAIRASCVALLYPDPIEFHALPDRILQHYGGITESVIGWTDASCHRIRRTCRAGGAIQQDDGKVTRLSSSRLARRPDVD